MPDDYGSELNVNYSTALLSTIQLYNAAQFAIPLAAAKGEMKADHFSSGGTIATHLKTALSDVGVTFLFQENQLPDRALDAAMRCGNIADAFLDFVGSLWGTDHAQSIMLLGQYYHPDLSSDQTTFWEDVLNIVKDPGFLLALAGIVTAFIPGLGTFASVLLYSSIAYNGIDLGIDIYNGDVTPPVAIFRGTVLIALLGAGVFAQKSGGLIAQRLLQLDSRVLAEITENLALVSADTLIGFTPHEGDAEGVVEHLFELFTHDLGMTPEEAQATIRQLGYYIESNGPIGTNPYAVEIPSTVETHTIPDYEGEMGSEFVDRERIEQNYPTNLNRDYPDFVAWMNARKTDMINGYIEAGFTQSQARDLANDPVMFSSYAEFSERPDHYLTLIQIAFRNVDPRWFSYD